MTADETWGEDDPPRTLGRAGSGPVRRDAVVRLDDHRRTPHRPGPSDDVRRRRREELDAVADHDRDHDSDHHDGDHHDAGPVDGSPAARGCTAGRPWARDDLAVAGLAGALGFAAAWSDAPAGSWVRTRLDALGDVELLRRWEAGRDAVDERPWSPRDLLGPVAALRRIRDEHVGGVRPADGLGEALASWLQHLATGVLIDDVVDGRLPLTGWARLDGLPTGEARRFARHVAGAARTGDPAAPPRPGVPPLPLLTVGTVVRAHVHGRACHERGTPELTGAERVLRDELLLVAHGLAGAASLGRAVAAAVTTDGPVALNHVTVPVLVRLGALGHAVASECSARIPEWVELLDRLDAPWELELAADIDARAPVVLPGLA